MMKTNYGLGNLNSFLLAFLIYLIVVGFVFFRLVAFKENAIRYTDIKDSFIDVEFAASSTPTPPVKEQEIKKEPEPIKEEVDVQKLFETTNKAVISAPVKQQATDFNALFGNVKEMQDQKDTKVQSSAKSAKQTSTPKQEASQIVKKLNDNLMPEQNKEQGDSTQKQRTGIYDEFLGRVTRMMNERWAIYYPSSKKIAVVVKIFIDENGNFGYTEAQKSYDSTFDTKVLEFLNSQKGKFIALPPKGQRQSITMNLGDDFETQIAQ